jgi:hypothetical protein
VLYIDTDNLDEPAPGYIEGPPVYDVPDDLVERHGAALAGFNVMQQELQDFWDAAKDEIDGYEAQ